MIVRFWSVHGSSVLQGTGRMNTFQPHLIHARGVQDRQSVASDGRALFPSRVSIDEANNSGDDALLRVWFSS